MVAKERSEFTLTDILAGINAKMVRRHAHIFGDEKADTAADVVAVWEKIKAREANRPKRDSLMDGVPAELSALNRAEKLQKRAAKVGFDWSESSQILDKIQEELDELKAAAASGDDRHTEEELGDLLFAIANYTRYRKGRTAEELLRAANDKFSQRFRYIEAELKAAGIPLESAGIDRMESLWQQAKRTGI